MYSKKKLSDNDIDYDDFILALPLSSDDECTIAEKQHVLMMQP